MAIDRSILVKEKIISHQNFYIISQMFLSLQIYALNKLMTEWENESFINFKQSNSGAPV